MFSGILGAFLAFHANYGYKRPKKPGIPISWGHIQPEYTPAVTTTTNANLTKRNVGNNNNNTTNVANPNAAPIQVQPQVGYPAV